MQTYLDRLAGYVGVATATWYDNPLTAGIKSILPMQRAYQYNIHGHWGLLGQTKLFIILQTTIHCGPVRTAFFVISAAPVHLPDVIVMAPYAGPVCLPGWENRP